MMPGDSAASTPLPAFDLDRPILGPESIQAATYLHAVQLGVDLSGDFDHLTLRQAMSMLQGWTTAAEQAEVVALNQDLWMLIGGRERLRLPPDTPPPRMTISSALRTGELRQGVNDFTTYLFAIVVAAYRRTSLTGSPASIGIEHH